MWRHTYKHSTNLTPEAIWPVLSDISNWSKIDPNIDHIEIDEQPGPGAKFVLKPKGGPKLNFRVGLFEAPRIYSDICKMPLAEMHTVHELVEGEVISEISIRGPLSAFWGLIVGRKHAGGLPRLTSRMLDAASKRKTN